MQATKFVFYFEDPLEFLNSVLLEKQKTNPRFSLREWARQIGYKNPSLLFQVLKGERKLKMDLALKIAGNLNMSGKSLRYFELLVLRRASQSPTERYVFETMLATLRPPKLRQISQMSLDLYAAVSDWYHWAIYNMAGISGFVGDVTWIQKRLGTEVDRRTIKTAIDRLTRLGLLAEQADGSVKQVSVRDSQILKNGVPVEALKQYHSQMIEKAKISVETQNDEQGQVKGATLVLSRDQLPQVKEIISEAHRKIRALSYQGTGDDVYQVNSQLFRLTNRKRKESEDEVGDMEDTGSAETDISIIDAVIPSLESSF